ALVRIGRIARDQRLDLGEQCVAAGVHRRLVQRWVTIEAIEAVAGEHCAIGCRDRDAPLRIEAQREIGYEAIHAPPKSPIRQRTWRRIPGAVALPGTRLMCAPVQPCPRLGNSGISWDLMAVNQASA